MATRTPASGDVVRIRGARWQIVKLTRHAEATVLDVRGRERSNRGERAFFILPFEPFERVPPSERPRVVSPRAWRREARSILASASPAYQALDSAPAAHFDLLPFQLEPALAVAGGLGSRLLIADDVGLGKTVQAGLVIAETLRRCPGEGRALVVCPASLREQWRQELRQRFQVDAAIVDAAALAGPSAVHPERNPWAAHAIVITSIDYVKRPEVMRALEPLVWDVVVFDEAHGLAGRSDRHTAAEALAGRSRVVVLLTATPHSGDDIAFGRLCGIGSLGGEFPLLAFRRTRADAGFPVSRRSRWLRVRPTAEELRMHAGLLAYARRARADSRNAVPGLHLAIAVLMRRASSSARSLARSIERRLALLADPLASQLVLPLGAGPADDDEPFADLAAPALADGDLERRLLEDLLARAREASTNESKLRRLRRLLTRIGEPAIVFTEYRDTLRRLEPALAPFSPALLHGGLTPSERRDAIRQFTSGTAGILLATDAASEGLNLHHRCRVVINLELPWTPLRLEQRVGRVERIGQRRRVHAIHLVASGTGEEAAAAALGRRTERAAGVLRALRDPRTDALNLVESFLGGAAPPVGPAGGTAAADGVTVVDLHDDAAREAARIASCRRLDGPAPASPGRPAAAIVRRRHLRDPAAYWAFRTFFVDDRQRHVWDSLAAVEALLRLAPAGKAASIGEWLADTWARLAPALQSREEAERRAFEISSGPAIREALRREHSIAALLQQRRARLAAALVQPGLFDDRGARAAAAQAAIVEEAAGRCGERIQHLAAMRHVAISHRELVFAVVRA